MDLAQKIKIARNNLGITQEKLSALSGISIQNIKKLETNLNSNPTNKTLKKLASALQVNEEYFVSKLSPNASSKMSPNVSQSTNLSKNLSPSQINLKNTSKSTNQQEVLNHNNDSSLVVRKSTDKNVRKSFVSDGKMSVNQTNLKVENSAQTLSDDMINIPFFENVRASAGSGAYNDEDNEQTMSLSKGFLRECFGLYSFANLSVILGQGDSMAPTLPENCYLLIQQGEVKEGEICVTRIEDELYVKRLQKRPKLKLLSDNKAYEPIDLEGENFEILGRVVGYFKKTTL
ncbi:LexA family transcriptional regulator [Campylobacter lari]|nr:LexA family transcriptional regulator [Campylobacter lari]